MMVEDFNIELTEDQRKYCEFRLRNWSSVARRLSDTKMYTVNVLRIMVRYEFETRGRKETLNRLTGRYYKLKKKQTDAQIKEYMKRHDSKAPAIIFNPEDLEV